VPGRSVDFANHGEQGKMNKGKSTMGNSALGGFFTGGVKGITCPDQPQNGRNLVTGKILAIHPPEDQLDPKTQKPTGKQQVRIELETTERDPESEFDDGTRTLYVKSYLRGAIGDALRKAGKREPEVGGTLTVRFDRTEPPEKPGLSPSKHFEAEYIPPNKTGQFFGTNSNSQSAPPTQHIINNGPAKPASISDAAWAAMDAGTRVAVANTMGALSDGPPF